MGRDADNKYKSFMLTLEEGIKSFDLGNSSKSYIKYFKKAGKR